MPQTGDYKIDVRFNKTDLIDRIEDIAKHRDRIELLNGETIELLESIFANGPANTFIFLDPPYYIQGEHLYLNFYDSSDHVTLRNILRDNRDANWFLTYDNCERINELYQEFRRSHMGMSYTLQEKKRAKEVMVFSDSLDLPRKFRVGAKSLDLQLL